MSLAERDKKRHNLTLRELESLPQGTNTYQGVGKMFLLVLQHARACGGERALDMSHASCARGAEAREGARSPTRVPCHERMIFLQTPCPEIVSSLHADNEKCDTATATLGGNLCPLLIVPAFLCSVSMRSSALGSPSLPPRGQHSSRACLSFCLERAGQKASLENAINAHEQKIRDFLMSCGGTGEVCTFVCKRYVCTHVMCALTLARASAHTCTRAHTHTHTSNAYIPGCTVEKACCMCGCGEGGAGPSRN